MKHTFFINFEGEGLDTAKLSRIFESYNVEYDDSSASDFNVMVNENYLEPLELDFQLGRILEHIENSNIKIGSFGIREISLWLNVYNDGNPFCWSFLNISLMKYLSNLDITVELDFYPIELTMS